jgi:hypothetical protein
MSLQGLDAIGPPKLRNPTAWIGHLLLASLSRISTFAVSIPSTAQRPLSGDHVAIALYVPPGVIAE